MYSIPCLGTKTERKETQSYYLQRLRRRKHFTSIHSQTHLQYYFSVCKRCLEAYSSKVYLLLLHASEEAGNEKKV